MSKRGPYFKPRSLEEYMGVKPLIPNRKNNTLPIQQMMFEGQSQYGFRRYIGAFYELITEGLFGGKWQGTDNVSLFHDDPFKPDIIHNGKDYLTITESKASSWRDNVKFADYQIDKYMIQQCTSLFLESESDQENKIFFALYKYMVRDPLSKIKNLGGNPLEEIINMLTKETGFLLYLPFSIIHIFHTTNGTSQYQSRYEGDRWFPISRISTTGLKEMLKNPQEVLESFGINPYDFVIQKTRTPNEFYVNRKKVEPFPILYIYDKNHRKWLNEFREKNLSRVNELIENGMKKDSHISNEYEEVSDEKLEEIPF